MSEQDDIFAKVAEAAKNRSYDAFGFALDLTKTYAASGSASAKELPRLFVNLFSLFSEGKNPYAKDGQD